MKKEILNFGIALSKEEQQTINGGNGNCGGAPSYSVCAATCYFPDTCERYHCNRQTSGWFCIDHSNNE